jgi:hypothetical protein
MSIDWLWQHLEGCETTPALTAMLRSDRRPVAFVVGSAVSAPDTRVPGSRGVPDVSGMVERIKKLFAHDAEASAELKQKLLAQPAQAYSAAMRFLFEWRGRDAVRVLLRDAVLEARREPEPGREWTEEELARIDDHDPDGWVLPPGANGLGALLVKRADRYSGPVLTTNFDPLVSAGIQRAGGQPNRTVLANDGQVPGGGCDSPIRHHVVHLHGYWRGGATLHTAAQLTAPRPMLRQSLQRMLRERIVVVVGYGGWNDAFIGTLRAMLFDEEIEIVWCCYEQRVDYLINRYRALFESMQELIQRSQLRIYVGIDCRTIFDLLLNNTPIATTTPAEPPPELETRASAEAPTPSAARAVNDASPESRSGDDTSAIPSDLVGLLLEQVKILRDAVVTFDDFLAATARLVGESSGRPTRSYPLTAVLLRLPGLRQRLGQLKLIRLDNWRDGALWVTEVRANVERAQDALQRFQQVASGPDPSNSRPPTELCRAIKDLRELIATRYPSVCDVDKGGNRKSNV